MAETVFEYAVIWEGRLIPAGTPIPEDNQSDNKDEKGKNAKVTGK